MMKMNKKGFTIVELVIVIAVIAILAAVMIPTFSGIVSKAQESAELQKVTAAYKDALAQDLADGKYDGAEISAGDYKIKITADATGKITKVEVIEGNEPSRISQADCDSYRKVAAAVSATWNGCITSPYLMVQCSDSRHYGRISDKVYRFSAMDLTKEERGTIHGNNERIRVETIHRAVEFYIRLLKQC